MLIVPQEMMVHGQTEVRLLMIIGIYISWYCVPVNSYDGTNAATEAWAFTTQEGLVTWNQNLLYSFNPNNNYPICTEAPAKVVYGTITTTSKIYYTNYGRL